MTKKEFKELTYFPKELDNAIIEKFGKEVQPYTIFDLFGDINYKTIFEAEGELKQRIEDFIDGYMKGNLELSARMHSKFYK